jgi:hypothetical protein
MSDWTQVINEFFFATNRLEEPGFDLWENQSLIRLYLSSIELRLSFPLLTLTLELTQNKIKYKML